MKLVNLTPHTLNLHGDDGTVVELPSAGVARCEETLTPRGEVVVDGATIRLVSRTLGGVTGLPDPAPDTLYIVSAMVAEAARRPDVVAPGGLVRDSEGRVVGASTLVVAGA